MQNSIDSIKGRLTRGMTSLSDSDVKILLLDIMNRLEELENATTNRAPGSDPVPGGKDSPAGTGKRRRQGKSDGKSTEESGPA